MDGPVRTCAGCRVKHPQDRLIRVARRGSGEVAVDVTSGARGPGRGAYLCSAAACLEKAIQSGSLRRILRLRGDIPDGLRWEITKRIEERDG